RLQKLAIVGIHHVQPALVDQHGLVLLPFFPGALGDIVVDVLALGARVGRTVEARQVFLVLAAVDGAGHGLSPAKVSAATRLSRVCTGAARPRRGGLARLYQSHSPSATQAPGPLTSISRGSISSWKWLKMCSRLGSARRSPRRSWCCAARVSSPLASSSSGRLHSPPQSPADGRR